MDHTRNLQLSILAVVATWPLDAERKPDLAVMAGDDLVVRLRYDCAEAHAERVSADVEALRSLEGFVCVESWSDAAMPLSVCLRYAPAPAVEAPRPIAPVPAPPSRRR